MTCKSPLLCPHLDACKSLDYCIGHFILSGNKIPIPSLPVINTHDSENK